MDTENIIIGRNAVKEALFAKRAIETLLIADGPKTGSLAAILAQAKSQNITIKKVDRKKLDALSGGQAHQGVLAVVGVKECISLEVLLSAIKEKGEAPFLVIADEIEDPHNLGAIIRSAECAGAHGIIIPKRRACGLTSTVEKASAGALEHLPVVRVTNIASTIDELKRNGIWVYGADMCGSTWCHADLTGAVALVVGNEGSGISRLVKEKCDGLLSLPMQGKISSLNASVAAGIILYEISRQRLGL